MEDESGSKEGGAAAADELARLRAQPIPPWFIRDRQRVTGADGIASVLGGRSPLCATGVRSVDEEADSAAAWRHSPGSELCSPDDVDLINYPMSVAEDVEHQAKSTYSIRRRGPRSLQARAARQQRAQAPIQVSPVSLTRSVAVVCLDQ